MTFDMDRIQLLNGATLESGSPLYVSAFPGPWSYIAAIPLQMTIWDAVQYGPARVTLDITAVKGDPSVGLVKADLSTFVAESPLVPLGQRSKIAFDIANLGEIGAIIVRGGAHGGELGVYIHRVSCEKLAVAPKPRLHRGFVNKSALDDIAHLARNPVSTIFDIGANIGDVTAVFLGKFPASTVYSFEPSPHLEQQLRLRFANEPRVKIHSKALGERNASRQLSCFSNSAINSLFPVSNAGPSFMEGDVSESALINVPVETLDTVITGLKPERIDILKLDTQGYEMRILEGASEALRKGSIEFILSELLFVDLYQGQAQYHEVARYLDEMGYRLFDLYDLVHHDNGQIKWADGLFVKKH